MSIDFQSTTPLYLQIAADIRAKIASGDLEVGSRLHSQAELAEAYGVSLITVKKALAELVNEGIVFSRVGKGSFVASRSGLHPSARHKTIGLVLRDLRSPFFSLIVHSVEEHASSLGYNLLLSNSSEKIEKEESQIRHFMEIGVQGLIVASMTHDYVASPLLREVHASGYPYIVVSYVKDPDVYFVGTDHEEGGYIATRHLLQSGYRTLGYINGEAGNLVGELRKEGFLKAHREQGLPPSERFMFSLRLRGEWNDYQSGYEVGEALSTLSERPDAIFAYNDLAALGCQRALLDAGLAVPDDVAIVGFDDIERGQYAPVPLSTIHQDTQQIGKLAVENLEKRIKGEQVRVKTILKPRLIVRYSCGCRR
jgi:DNA-binding LacI/PurR family transcriptional regulator